MRQKKLFWKAGLYTNRKGTGKAVKLISSGKKSQNHKALTIVRGTNPSG